MTIEIMFNHGVVQLILSIGAIAGEFTMDLRMETRTRLLPSWYDSNVLRACVFYGHD